MSQYVEFFLLGLLIVIINNVPEFMCSAVNNKVMLFLLILTIGFIYEWKKGALEWE